MFSFLSKTSSKESTNDKIAAAASAATFTPPVTNSSHEGNSLFGGMDLSSDVAVEPVEEPSGSGFSFMQSSEPEPTEEVSSFSFLNSSNDVAAETVQPTAAVPEKSVDLLSSPIKAAEPPQNLKMAKSSAPKVVKKKKRVSRVGLGREEDEEDDQPATTTNNTAAGTPSQGLVHSHSLPSVSEVTHDEHSDNESEVHSATVPAESASAFDFLVETTATSTTAPASAVTEEVPPAHTGGTRPSLLSFSYPEDHSTAAPALSLADFDGMMVHDSAPITASAKPISAHPVVAVTQPPAKAVEVKKELVKEAPVVAGVAVAANKSTQDQSVVKLNSFHQSVVSMYKVYSSSVQESKRIRAQIDSESNNLVLLKSQLTGLENEQAKHAAEEDFDRADMMSGPIEQTKEEIEKKTALIEALREQATALEGTFAAQRQQIVTVVQKTFDELSGIKDQLMVEAAELESTQIEGNEIEEIRIRVEEERISLEKSHFEKEEAALGEELRVTEEAIRSQSGAVQQKKEDIELSLLSVQSEIKLLEQQLAAKKLEEAHLQKELTHVDTKITEVRKKYERQLQRIQDRSYALAETKRECLAEEAALRAEKEQYASAAQEALDARESFVGWTRRVRDDLQVMDLFVRNAEKAEGDFKLLVNSTAATAGATGDGTAVLQAAQNDALTALSHATAAETQMKQEIEQLTVEGRAIAEQIPKLELEKKSHATSKRFKEAAAVAKDIKDGQSRKEEIDLKIEELSRAVEAQSVEVEKANEAHRQAAQALRDVQKEVEIERCRRLLGRARELRSLLKKVTRVKAGEQQQQYKLSPGLSSSVSDVSGGVSSFFSAELDDVMEEAHSIKQSHQLPESMFAEAEIGEEEEEVEQDLQLNENDTVEVKEALLSESAAEESTADIVNEVIADVVDSSLLEGENKGEEEVAEKTREEEETVAAVEDPVETEAVATEVDMVALKELKSRIESLNESLGAATESEDYERAAELDEEITALTAELQSKLSAAGITEAEL